MGQKKIFFGFGQFFPYFDPRMVNIHCIIFCHLEENFSKQKDMKNFGYKYFSPPKKNITLNGDFKEIHVNLERIPIYQ